MKIYHFVLQLMEIKYQMQGIAVKLMSLPLFDLIRMLVR